MTAGRGTPRRALTALAVALALCAPGCTYLQHRALDLEQSIHYGVGVSTLPGVAAHVHVPLFGATLGLLDDSTYVGSDYGYIHRWRLQAGGLGLFGGLTREVDRGQSAYGRTVSDDAYVASLEFMLWHARERDRRMGSTLFSVSQVEIDAHALFVGVSLGLDFVQLLDFLTGCFGFDLLEDDGVDYGQSLREELEAEAARAAAAETDSSR